MRGKAFTATLAAAVALGLVAGAFAGEKKIVIGYSNIADSDVFCTNIKILFEKEVAARPDVEVLFADAMFDNMRQLEHIDNFIVQGVDAIVLATVDYAGVTPGVEKANAAGIPVVCLVNAAEGGESTYVASPNFEAGRLQGEFMRENLPQNAKVLYLYGTLGLSPTQMRWEGFKAACLDKRPDITVLSALTGNFERDQGMKITEDWIQSFPEFHGIISGNDQMALGAIQALKVAGRLDGVLVSGVDGVEDALASVKSGDMSQSIFYDAQNVAKTGLDAVLRRVAGETLPKEIMVPFISVTKENAAQYVKD